MTSYTQSIVTFAIGRSV